MTAGGPATNPHPGLAAVGRELGALYEEYRALYGLVEFRMTAMDRRVPVTAGALTAAIAAMDVVPRDTQLLILLAAPLALVWFVRATVNHARSFEDVLRRIEEIERAVNDRLGTPVLHVVKKGKTPVLTADEARQLLDSVHTLSIGGLRDRAMIGVMVYSFARVSAVVGMDVRDYFQQGKRWWFRLHEKGGKVHEVPAHHKAEEYLDAYLAAAGIAGEAAGPLFRTLDRRRRLTSDRITRRGALAMVKRRARRAGLPTSVCCHTFRATGITAYLLNGGTIEKAQTIAAHESPRTTKLYDRTSDDVSLDEIEKILI